MGVWKIQNSWGTNWGDNGYVYFEAVGSYGVCGMNQIIEWMTVADPADITTTNTGYPTDNNNNIFVYP